MRPTAVRVARAVSARAAGVRTVASGGVAKHANQTERGFPDDIDIRWLSMRSLMDYCTGRGQWRSAAGAAAATRLEDLPLVDAETAPAIQAELAVRGVPEARFLRWYNAFACRTWAECAAQLAPLTPNEVPTFVLQRSLQRVEEVADTSDAVRVAKQYLPTLGVEEAHRVCLVLVDRCFRNLRAWHVARPLVAVMMDTARRWVTKRTPQPTQAAALLRTGALRLLPADDPRARAAFVRLVQCAREYAPDAAMRIAEDAVRHRGALLDVATVRALLAACPDTESSPSLYALGVHVAAAAGDTEQARAWYAALGTPGPSVPTTAFLKALAHSAHDADVRQAWALFDALCEGSISEAKTARLADWTLMVRAAASDARIASENVAALLDLRDAARPVPRAHWRAPPRMQPQLSASVVAHTALLDGFMARGDLPRAWAAWDAMVRRGLAPDAWALASLCRLFFRAGLPARALESVATWCHAGGRLGAERSDAPVALRHVEVSDLRHVPIEARTAAARARVEPTGYLANVLLAGLLRAGAHEALVHVWQMLGATLRLRPDVVSLDLVLSAAIAESRLPTRRAEVSVLQPYAARSYFRRALLAQHPELRTVANPLESRGARGWLLRGELQLRRWERWVEERLASRVSGGAGTTGELAAVPGAPVPMCFDARVFHRYCELLVALLDAAAAGVPGAPTTASLSHELTEELFLVAAWMRALDLVPLRATLCLWCSAQDERLPPVVGKAPIRAWLAQWTDVPDEAETAAWFRRHRQVVARYMR